MKACTGSVCHCAAARTRKTRGGALLAPPNHGTQIRVTNSYLGIVAPRGLETLVIETEHAAVFLFRRAGRRPDGDAACCWAVLDERTARNVMRQIDCRRFRDAFWQLNAQAVHLGTLLPPLTEDDVFCAMP